MTDLGRLRRTTVVWGLFPSLVGGALVSTPMEAQETSAPGATVEFEGGDLLTEWAREHLEGVNSGGDPAGADIVQRLERIRAMYFLSVEEKEWADRARDSLRAIRDAIADGHGEEVTFEAYRGALEVVRAKHARWPPNKLKHLNRGEEILDGLVARDPSNLEVRYLRLASYMFLPFFLRRDEAVAEDLEALVSGLPEHPGAFSPAVYRAVLRFVLDNGELDEANEKRFREALGEEPTMILRTTEGVNPHG